MTQEELEDRFPDVVDGTRVSRLCVMLSGGGYYLGRACWTDEGGGLAYAEPYSRESEYFETRPEAEAALASGRFEVRLSPENLHAYRKGLKVP